MKHIFLTVFTFMLLSGVVYAQHINIGIKGGLNAYTLQSSASRNYNPRVGFNLGLLGHIHLDSRFAIQPEILFSLQGAEYKVAGTNFKLNLNYINIPLNVQYMFDNGFRLQAGPQLGVLVTAEEESGIGGTDAKSDYKSADIGVTFGVSYVKPSTGFGVDVRYNHGLTNILSNESSNTFNRGVQLSLFYLFNHHS